jgi:hypothetical protein
MDKLDDMRKQNTEKICGQIYENGYWRKKTNKKIYKEFKSPHVLIKERRLKWTGLILRMCCTRTTKKLLDDKNREGGQQKEDRN